MTVYIDTDYKCHVVPIVGARGIEESFFDNKCPSLIESYRYVPAEATWTREDGVAFAGPMIAPWRDIRQYDSEQREYERQQIAQYEAALTEIEAALGVNA